MNIKKALTNLIQIGRNQTKNISNANFCVPQVLMTQNFSDNQFSSLSKNISFGITHAKHVTESRHGGSDFRKLKKFQKTATYVHCFNPKTHHQEDVPIRIFRTLQTVTFLPSIQYLELQYPKDNKLGKIYEHQKDVVMTVYQFGCKHCGHKESRQFPENGYRFGTVLTGCDQCHELVVISDHLGWLEPKKQKQSNDLIFSEKNVMGIIKKNMKKVGFNLDKQDHY